jgi:hypothetical protein
MGSQQPPVRLEQCPNCGEKDELVDGSEYNGPFEAGDTVCLACDRVFNTKANQIGGINSEVAEELHSSLLDALTKKVALNPAEEMDEEIATSTMEFFRFAHGATMLRYDRLKDVLEYWLLHRYHSEFGRDVFDVEYSVEEGNASVETASDDVVVDNPKEIVVEYASEVLYGTNSDVDEDIRKARSDYGLEPISTD